MTDKSDIGPTGRSVPAPGDPSDGDDAVVARWRAAMGEAAPTVETLAALAEGRISSSDAAAVDAWLASNPAGRADVDAAREAHAKPLPEADEAIVARALGLVPGASAAAPPSPARPDSTVVPFRRPVAGSRAPTGRPVREVLRWAAMAASVALVSYVGFELGSDAYVSFATLDPAVGSRLHGDILFEPTPGFFGGLGEASAT